MGVPSACWRSASHCDAPWRPRGGHDENLGGLSRKLDTTLTQRVPSGAPEDSPPLGAGGFRHESATLPRKFRSKVDVAPGTPAHAPLLPAPFRLLLAAPRAGLSARVRHVPGVERYTTQACSDPLVGFSGSIPSLSMSARTVLAFGPGSSPRAAQSASPPRRSDLPLVLGIQADLPSFLSTHLVHLMDGELPVSPAAARISPWLPVGC